MATCNISFKGRLDTRIGLLLLVLYFDDMFYVKSKKFVPLPHPPIFTMYILYILRFVGYIDFNILFNGVYEYGMTSQ